MKKIIISRTDNLGDVVLTLPMAGLIKQHLPGTRILFLGKRYTRPLIDACEHVDEFLDWDEIAGHPHPFPAGIDAIIHVFPVKEICLAAKKAGIPLRIGTSHRWFTWIYCNKLLHFTRKNSTLHEAQLNLKMLEPLGIPGDLSLGKIPDYYGLTRLTYPSTHPLITEIVAGEGIFNLILHPKSKGSAREWGLENFSRLIDLLPEGKFRIFITGTKDEGDMMHGFLEKHRSRIKDLTGKLTLPALIAFIHACDGLVAASTGPLHIAAALGKQAIGIYPPIKPMHPERWAPLGKHADFLVLEKECNKCRHSLDCECIRSIRPEEVAQKLMAV